MMELSLRCRHWSVLQVVAIVVFYQEKVLSERAQGCVWSQLSLRCPDMKVIQITGMVLGDSSCSGSSCCIKDSDCTRDANADHKTDVNSRCNNRQSCTVGVLREKIPCGTWGVWLNNDFERITYNCINDPQRSTTATFSRTHSTRTTFRTEENTSKKETEKGSTAAKWSTSSRSASSSTEDAEETPSKMETEKGSTPATFSQLESTENRLRTEEITPKKETETDETPTSIDLQTKEVSEQNVNGHYNRSDNSRSTTRIFSRSDSAEDILRTEVTSPEKEREHDVTTSSSATQNGEIDDETTIDGHDKNVRPEDRTDNTWSTTATFRRSDSTQNILHVEEIPQEKNTEAENYDETATSTYYQTKQGQDQRHVGDNGNVTHEDRLNNSWSTTATQSRQGSTEDILRTWESPPETETKNGLTTATSSRSDSKDDILLTDEKQPEKKTKNVDTASSADVDKNKKGSYDNLIGHDGNGSPENWSDNPWMIPVVMATVCLLILIALVVLVVMMRRNKRVKGIVAAEMTTYFDGYPSEAINGINNQTMSLNNNGSGVSPIHSNDKIKESNNKDPEVSDNYEVPNNADYSVACDTGSLPTEDPIAMESRESQPRSDIYSVARDIEEPDCSASTEDASKEDNNVTVM